MKEYGFVYITTNLVNGKRYIGQRKFYHGHECYLGSGKAIASAVKKYGRHSFSREVLCVAYSKEELDRWEYFCICAFGALNNENFYNMRAGGDSPGMSADTRVLMSKNSGKAVGFSHFETNPTTRGNFIKWCKNKGFDFLEFDEFDSGEKTRTTRKFYYVKKAGETPIRVESKMFTSMKPLGYHESNPTKRNDFKLWCNSYGVDFDEFVEVEQDNKTKWGHKLYTYYKK